jgi:hypothetical protein
MILNDSEGSYIFEVEQKESNTDSVAITSRTVPGA